MARHRGMKPVITSVKHYVHVTNQTLASNVALAIVVADAVVAPATGNAFDVKEGSIVKAVHLELWLQNVGASNNATQFELVIEKVPANQASVTNTQILNLGAYLNKKNILFTSQGIIANSVDGANSVPIIRDWVLIPKGKQRMGQGDRIVMTIFNLGFLMRVCGLQTYKEYT